MQVPARELQPSLTGIELGPRNAPDHRQSCALPSHQDGACRCGIAQRIGMDAHPSPGLVIPHPTAIEERVQASGRVLGAMPGLGGGGQPTEREDRPITRGDDVSVEPRPPQLDERRVLPRGRLGPRNASVNRENCGARHAVLQARPRRALERGSARRQPLVERSRPASVRQYLRPGEVERRRHHAARRAVHRSDASVLQSRLSNRSRPPVGGRPGRERAMSGSNRWSSSSAAVSALCASIMISELR